MPIHTYIQANSHTHKMQRKHNLLDLGLGTFRGTVWDTRSQTWVLEEQLVISTAEPSLQPLYTQISLPLYTQLAGRTAYPSFLSGTSALLYCGDGAEQEGRFSHPRTVSVQCLCTGRLGSP